VATDQLPLVVEVEQRVVESAAFPLAHAHDYVCPCLAARGAKRLSRPARHFDGVEVELAEQRGSSWRSVGPYPVRIARDERLGKRDHPGAAPPGGSDQIAGLGNTGFSVEKDRSSMYGGYSRGWRSIAHVSSIQSNRSPHPAGPLQSCGSACPRPARYTLGPCSPRSESCTTS